MVTFLDIGLLQYFSIIFPILLIFCIVFAILHKTKILGENATINAIIAVALALMSLLFPDVIELINFIAPWFVLVFVFLILLLLLYQMLGATEKDIFSALSTTKEIQWGVAGIAIVIIIAGFASVWGEKMLAKEPILGEGEVAAEETTEFEENIYLIFTSPQVLGLIFIFLIAIFAIAFLAGG